ncbi:MAG: hypothetical protein AAGC54_19815 [Cyanobacteria bacterium P01_F01_bin.4]
MPLNQWIFWSFLPAAVGLLWHCFSAPSLPVRFLNLAFFLLCLEQARMATLDLQRIQLANPLEPSRPLRRFRRVTLVTIGLELLGFYSAVVWLTAGAVWVLASLIFFNSFASVQIDPEGTLATRPLSDRLPILAADGISLLLVSLWHLQIAPLGISLTLVALIALDGGIKYGPLVLSRLSALRW